MKRKSSLIATAAIILFTVFVCAISTSAQTPIKNIVLVHGAFADGSSISHLL